jgi:AcrR family transcriptional regulator
MITPRKALRQPTKQRLLDEGVRLFAKNGFRETTVGEIEEAAGLEPRRGALYRHFPSKEGLLEAALDAHLDALANAGQDLPTSGSDDPRETAVALARWMFGELDREQSILRILEQDGDRLIHLRDRFRDTLMKPGYQLITKITREWAGASATSTDPEAIAAVLLSALVNYRRSAWTFDYPPGGLSQDRYVSAWADLCVTYAQTHRRPNSRSTRSKH